MSHETLIGGNLNIQARFESMRRHVAQQKRVFQRHRDLNNECRKRVALLERETRVIAARISRITSEFEDRKRVLEEVEESTVGTHVLPPLIRVYRQPVEDQSPRRRGGQRGGPMNPFLRTQPVAWSGGDFGFYQEEKAGQQKLTRGGADQIREQSHASVPVAKGQGVSSHGKRKPNTKKDTQHGAGNKLKAGQDDKHKPSFSGDAMNTQTADIDDFFEKTAIYGDFSEPIEEPEPEPVQAKPNPEEDGGARNDDETEAKRDTSTPNGDQTLPAISINLNEPLNDPLIAPELAASITPNYDYYERQPVAPLNTGHVPWGQRQASQPRQARRSQQLESIPIPRRERKPHHHHRKKKRTLLFRIEKTDGQVTYINELRKPSELERKFFKKTLK